MTVYNGETVIGATIFLKEASNIGAITNVYGFYFLTAPVGEYTLVFRSIGFVTKEKKINLTKDMKIDMEIKEDIMELSEIVISAEDDNKANVETPEMSVTKLSTKDIKQVPVVMGEVYMVKAIQLITGCNQCR